MHVGKRGGVLLEGAAPGAGSSWTRQAPGRVRQEAEGPEGLGCGPKRDEGGPGEMESEGCCPWCGLIMDKAGSREGEAGGRGA